MYDGQTGKPANYLGRSVSQDLVGPGALYLHLASGRVPSGQHHRHQLHSLRSPERAVQLRYQLDSVSIINAHTFTVSLKLCSYVVIDDSSEGDGSYAESAPLQVSGASVIPTSGPGSGASALTSSTVVQRWVLHSAPVKLEQMVADNAIVSHWPLSEFSACRSSEPDT